KSQIKEFVLQGVYVNRDYEGFTQRAGTPSSESFAPRDIQAAAERLQEHFTKVDKFGSEIARKGGMSLRPPRLHMSDSPWKADDAAWFEANPTRSHRLRPILAGEAEQLFDGSSVPVLPPGHEYQ